MRLLVTGDPYWRTFKKGSGGAYNVICISTFCLPLLFIMTRNSQYNYITNFIILFRSLCPRRIIKKVKILKI